jgi:hypothetical protein
MARKTGAPWRATTVLAGAALAVAGVLAGAGPACATGRLTAPHAGWAAAAKLLPGGRNVPQPGKSTQLNGVYCTSSGNCWAVGQDTGSAGVSDQNELLHWNGSKWSQASIASPGGTGANHFSELYAVRCLSASDCWTVGDFSRGKAVFAEAYHWNGKKWASLTMPTPGGTLEGDVNELYDVVCASSSDCWAGGEYGTQTPSGSELLNLIVHWNGKSWSTATTPNPAGTSQNRVQDVAAIRCTSASNCLAVGTYGNATTLILQNEGLHWNGKKWSKQSMPNPGGTGGDGNIDVLSGLGCTTATNCWAAGTFGLFGTLLQNDVLHWNGKKWSMGTAPNASTNTGAENELQAINCLSASNCWTVGFDEAPGPSLNEALHWNGKQWSQSTVPNPAGTGKKASNDLFSIRCTSGSNCWAVGQDQRTAAGPAQNEALHWNGKKWSSE